MVRGRRRATEKVPKPTRVTASPRRSAPRTPVSVARSARAVTTFDHPVASAIRETSSARVTSLHAEDGARFVHHLLGDGRVALLFGESLDRAPGHRPDEGRDPLEPGL